MPKDITIQASRACIKFIELNVTYFNKVTKRLHKVLSLWPRENSINMFDLNLNYFRRYYIKLTPYFQLT